MNQLRMVKPDISVLPEANIPGGYELRVLREDEKTKWEGLCFKAFGSKHDFKSVIEDKKGYAPDGVFVITDITDITGKDKLIATGTALLDCNDNGYGYVHMIAADPDYSGKKLGYEITAAVLRRLRGGGFDKAELTTDDFRLPAIKTYLNLGFVPDMSVDETMRGRWEKIYIILNLGNEAMFV